jgi:hypothetical protein
MLVVVDCTITFKIGMMLIILAYMAQPDSLVSLVHGLLGFYVSFEKKKNYSASFLPCKDYTSLDSSLKPSL